MHNSDRDGAAGLRHLITGSKILVDAGCAQTRNHAIAWLQSPTVGSTAELLVARLTPWVESGIPARIGYRWLLQGFSAHEGIDASLRGWTPRTYRALLLMESADSSFRDANPHLVYNQVIDGWVTSGINPTRALRYREAGLSCQTAQDMEAKRLSGEATDAAIDVLLALRTPPRARRSRSWEAFARTTAHEISRPRVPPKPTSP